jgi:hypothetical protein
MKKTDDIRELVSQARIEMALQGILQITVNTNFASISSAISGSYSKYKRDIMMGILDKDEENKIYAGITNRILTLLNQIESDTDQPESSSGQNVTFSEKAFISYAWGGESEEIANRIEMELKHDGIHCIRDKSVMKYKDSIRSFMKEMGMSRCVVVIISDKYLKSQNCLFELLQIAEKGSFVSRTFPVVLADARIFDPLSMLSYIRYWEQKTKELEDAIKTVSLANLHGIREDLDLYTEIRAFLPRLADTIKNMNTLTVEAHRNSNFHELGYQIKALINPSF